MKIRYHWILRTYSGRFATVPGLRWLAPRKTVHTGITDSIDRALLIIFDLLNDLKEIDPEVYVKTSVQVYRMTR